MAVKYTAYGVGNSTLTSMIQSLNALTIGFHQVSLTNWSTTAAPDIALGSIVEVNNNLYESVSTETITGSTPNGYLYIKTILSTSDTISFQFSTVVPEWNTTKQYFGSPSSSESDVRFLNFKIYNSSGLYTKEFLEL